jgi:hypothetical protein
MKSVDEINAGWMAGTDSALAAISALLVHFTHEGVEPVLSRLDPSLRVHVVAFAKAQNYGELIPKVRREGEDPAPLIALRDWLARMRAAGIKP